ncbi:MAG: beta strand repeat-containing protein, partial [Niastella sp.]|uniref:beta strand repeat-containing protein n=1 Tax=Niastella sp. TaxID=1869183 RepID=UPI003899EDE7
STYSWTGPNSFTSSSATPSIANVTTAASGVYTVIVTNGNGCSATTTTSVTINALPTPTASSNTPQCAGSNLNLTTSGGSTYSWTGPNGFTSSSATPSIANVTTAASGVYTVIVTNGNGCSATTTTSVTINALPTPTASSNTPQCAGSNLNLTTSGGSTYSWTGPNGFTSSSANPSIANVTNAASGVYTVIVTNGNGCSATTTTSVTINALPTPTAGSNTPQCAGSTLNLTASGGSTYSWTGPNSFTSSSATPSIANVTTAASGVYTVIVTNGNGCSATTTTTVTVNPRPAVTNANAATICSGTGPNISLTASVPGTFAWTIGTITGGITGASAGSGSTINQTLTNPSNTTAGTVQYIVTPTSSPGGCAGTPYAITITVNPRPAIPTISAGGPTTFCQGGSVTLTSSSATGNQWSLNGTGVPGATNQTYSTTTSGSYTVTVTNGNGCARTSAATSITVNPLPTITVSPAAPAAFCSGGSVTLTASGANTYTWSPATDLSITTGNIVNAYPSVTTTYTVTGTGANGCIGTANVTVTVTQGPSGDVSSSPAVCPGANSGTLTLSNYTGNILRWESSTDGGATWTTISNTSTSQSYLNLTTTTIYRVALELNGCNDYSSIGIVPVNPPFTPTVTATPSIFCLGQSAVLKASDYGPPPFPVEDFQNANPAGWNGNDANSNNKDDNSAWGETGNGKTFNGKVFNSNAAPTNTKFMIVNGDGGGSTVSLVTPPFSLVGLTNPTFNYYTALNFNAGTTGWVEISTNGGLSYTTLKTYTGPTNVGNPNNGFIQESINLSAYIGQTNVMVRFRYSGTAGSNWAVDNVGIAGTYQPVTYQWSPTTYLTPATGIGQTVTTTPTAAGTFNYCVVATTAAGCASSPVCVDVVAKPIPTCSITGASIVCPAATTTYSAPAIAGYTYKWTISGGATISGSSTGQTVTVVANNTCGTYTLTLVTTLNGCSSTPCTQIVNVVDNTAPVATAPATQSFQCLADVPAPGTLTATDNCSGNITATGVDVRVANGCGYTITRKWTFTDACNNTTSVSQIINVLDNTVPVAP